MNPKVQHAETWRNARKNADERDPKVLPHEQTADFGIFEADDFEHCHFSITLGVTHHAQVVQHHNAENYRRDDASPNHYVMISVKVLNVSISYCLLCTLLIASMRSMLSLTVSVRRNPLYVVRVDGASVGGRDDYTLSDRPNYPRHDHVILGTRAELAHGKRTADFKSVLVGDTTANIRAVIPEFDVLTVFVQKANSIVGYAVRDRPRDTRGLRFLVR